MLKRTLETKLALRLASYTLHLASYISHLAIHRRYHTLKRTLETKLASRGGARAHYLEGWLWKSGQFNPSFHRRWCVLTADGLLAYARDRSADIRGVIVRPRTGPTRQQGVASWVQPGSGGGKPGPCQ